MSDLPSANALLPCPYCGKVPVAAIEIDVAMWAVACAACQAIGPVADSESAAEAAWNQRPQA